MMIRTILIGAVLFFVSLTLPVFGSGEAQVVNVNVWVVIDHSSRTDLVLEMGVGNPASPDFVTILQARQTNPHVPFNQNINQIYDGDVPNALWPPPPGSSNTYWLRVTDEVQGNFGILRSWCLNDEPLSPAVPRSPAVSGIRCEYSPMDLFVPLDITDFQSTISFIGDNFGIPGNPGQQPCAGIYGDLTTRELLGGPEFSFYIQRTGNTLTGTVFNNVLGVLVIGDVNGFVDPSGTCFLAVTILSPPVCSMSLAGTLEDIDVAGSTVGLFDLGGGTNCEGIIPPTAFELPKVSG